MVKRVPTLFGGRAVPFFVGMTAVGLGLRRLDDFVLVFRRSVNGVKLQRCPAGVADIVPRASRDDDAAAVLDIIGVVVDVDLAIAFLETEELVAVLVYLRSD